MRSIKHTERCGGEHGPCARTTAGIPASRNRPRIIIAERSKSNDTSRTIRVVVLFGRRREYAASIVIATLRASRQFRFVPARPGTSWPNIFRRYQSRLLPRSGLERLLVGSGSISVVTWIQPATHPASRTPISGTAMPSGTDRTPFGPMLVHAIRRAGEPLAHRRTNTVLRLLLSFPPPSGSFPCLAPFRRTPHVGASASRACH